MPPLKALSTDHLLTGPARSLLSLVIRYRHDLLALLVRAPCQQGVGIDLEVQLELLEFPEGGLLDNRLDVFIVELLHAVRALNTLNLRHKTQRTPYHESYFAGEYLLL